MMIAVGKALDLETTRETHTDSLTHTEREIPLNNF